VWIIGGTQAGISTIAFYSPLELIITKKCAILNPDMRKHPLEKLATFIVIIELRSLQELQTLGIQYSITYVLLYAVCRFNKPI
jgi:hypothetical protein